MNALATFLDSERIKFALCVGFCVTGLLFFIKLHVERSDDWQ